MEFQKPKLTLTNIVLTGFAIFTFINAFYEWYDPNLMPFLLMLVVYLDAVIEGRGLNERVIPFLDNRIYYGFMIAASLLMILWRLSLR